MSRAARGANVRGDGSLPVTLSLRSLTGASHNVPTVHALHASRRPVDLTLFGSTMHEQYASGEIHPESPVSGDAVRQVIADVEVLLQAASGERWPARATIPLGEAAVLRCTSRPATGAFVYGEVLVDISMDRLQRQPVAEGSHVSLPGLAEERGVRPAGGSCER